MKEDLFVSHQTGCARDPAKGIAFSKCRCIHSLSIDSPFNDHIVAVLELVGGIMLIVGLFTRYLSALFVVMLIGAIYTAKLSAGLLGNGQTAGYELDLGFMLISIYLAVADMSPLSVDKLIMNKRRP